MLTTNADLCLGGGCLIFGSFTPIMAQQTKSKLANHAAAIALHYMHYNFCRIHKTLRVTPAMEAGLTDHVWSFEEVGALLDTNVKPMKRGPYKKKSA